MVDQPVLGPRPEPAPVLGIIGVLAADFDGARDIASSFAEDWGGLELEGEPEDFADTDYYEPEMGGGLVRNFFALGSLIPAERLADLKLFAWEVESAHLERGRRRINLDPGYLDFGKVVLASFKVGPQKLHLGRGVWADTILFWDHGRFTPLRWTFPDFKAGAHADFFAAARALYKRKLRER